MRRLAGGFGALLLLTGCVGGHVALPPAPIPYGPTIAVRTTPVPLDPSDPARTAVDGFRYAGGVALTSDQTSDLHSLSDLVLSPGGRITSVTDDSGKLFTARLVLDADGRLTGVTDVAMRPLVGEDSQPLQGKAWTDAEGLAILGNGELLVSFERNHRIWRYPPSGDRKPFPVAWPKIAMPENDGMEGLAAAPNIAGDAYWVGVEGGGFWLCRLHVGCDEVDGLPRIPAGFRISAIAVGPEGELIILHHSYIPAIGSRFRVTVVRDPRGARQVIGQFALGPSSTSDNMEGIAVERKPDGDWRLYLLSDDNAAANQRTVLLAFDWTPPK